VSAMRRRDFVSFLGSAAIWPHLALAQRPQMRRIGVLTSGDESDLEAQSFITAFREELRGLGWTEGRNIEIATRWAKADVELMKRSAQELVMLQPDLILTSSTPATAVMLQQTRTIPVVFLLVADPVGSRFVASLPRPGGNATGFTPIVGSLGGKWVELLKESAPRVGKIILIFNPSTATFIETFRDSFEAAAASLGMETSVAPVHDMHELESLVSASGENSGLVVIPDAFTAGHVAEIALLADRCHVPAIFWSRSFAEGGGLMSYGPVLVDEYRRAAAYADRILKGEKPSELPVQTPVKFELVINIKTAKALGLTVPDTLRMLADEVIE
jgi:putative tryptophan/tyrosine transport system substrate-binding protein